MRRTCVAWWSHMGRTCVARVPHGGRMVVAHVSHMRRTCVAHAPHVCRRCAAGVPQVCRRCAAGVPHFRERFKIEQNSHKAKFGQIDEKSHEAKSFFCVKAISGFQDWNSMLIWVGTRAAHVRPMCDHHATHVRRMCDTCAAHARHCAHLHCVVILWMQCQI